MSITVTTPTSPVANIPFVVSGSLVGYTSAPVLQYFDDEVLQPLTNVREVSATGTSVTIAWDPEPAVTMVALPSGAQVTSSAFSFTHPGLSAGDHTLEVSDGKVTGFAHVHIAAPTTESAEGTIVEKPTDPPIIDILGDVWTLTADHHILINGNVDTRTGAAEVDVLYYHNHFIYQQNSKGTWYDTSSPTDVWHIVTSPLITHFGVIAELLNLKGMLGKGSVTQQVTLCNQIIAEVWKLMP